MFVETNITCEFCFRIFSFKYLHILPYQFINIFAKTDFA